MQHSWKLKAGIIALTIMIQAGPAAARGGNCEELPLAADALVAAMDASQTLFDTLQTLDAELAIIGRVGSDLSGRGLKYSHAAFVWRDHPKGRWSVVHLLNLCGDDTGGLFEQGLLNFFLDDPFRLDVKLLVPTPDLQKGIVREIRSARALRLFQPEYSILANPWAARYQNSNQWLIEVTALAQAGAVHAVPPARAAAQDWLRAHDFRGTTIYVSPLEQLFGGLFQANLRFDDHPQHARMRGAYEVVTVRAVEDYLARTGGLSLSRELISPVLPPPALAVR